MLLKTGGLGSIAVREGRVRLYSTSLKGFDMVLTSGDFGSIDPAKKSQNIQKITAPIVLETQEDISFSNTPIANVFSSLSKHFGVEIEVKGDLDCLLTSPLVKNSSLDQAFEVISTTHEGLTITESARSIYTVTGTCN